MFAVPGQDTLNDYGTDTDAEVHRQAYNAAFDELGLSWHWDPVTYACLPAAGPEGLRAYLEKEHAHLLRAYEADFLVTAIETAKSRCYEVMTRNRAARRMHGQRPADVGMRQPA
jgi:hypothetical protein